MRSARTIIGVALVVIAVAAITVLALDGEDEFEPSWWYAEWECPDGTMVTYLDTDDPDINAEPPECP